MIEITNNWIAILLDTRIMLDQSLNACSRIDLTNMKITQSTMLSARQREQCVLLGAQLARLRIARRVKQADAALRAGLSRNTVYRLEKGEPGVALGQVLRYLEAIAPGSTLIDLLSETDPALLALDAKEKTRRVRDMSATELKELDF
jgi:transcriptional regulator with XRE-family HTH domain